MTSFFKQPAIFLAVAAIAGAFYFFGELPGQDPRSIAAMPVEESAIRANARTQLQSLGFTDNDFKISRVQYRFNDDLLDSLQHRLGRQTAIRRLKSDAHANLHPFYWTVEFSRERTKSKPSNADADQSLTLHLNPDGQFIEADYDDALSPASFVDRAVLQSVITPPDSTPSLLAAYSDSLLNRYLYYDLQKSERTEIYEPVTEQRVQQLFDRGIPYRLSPDDAIALARRQLQQTGWQAKAFTVDSLYVQRLHSVNAMNVQLTATDSLFGQSVQLNVVSAPSGRLLQLQASYQAESADDSQATLIWGVIYTTLYIILGISLLVVFFFRIRSRTVDTQKALIPAFVMGLAVAAYFLLQLLADNPFRNEIWLNQLLILFLQVGVTGAFASVGFFVLLAVGDSVTRQHWPAQLATYDYLRQGMAFNQPVGSMLLRGVAGAFVLAGSWALLLKLIPALYLSPERIFISQSVNWPPLFVLLRSSWYSFYVILITCLILGSLSYGQFNKKWISGAIIIAAAAFFHPFFMSTGPAAITIAAATGMGVILALLYVQWDFMTVFVAHALFLGLVQSSTGWMLPASPDRYLFWAFMASVVLISAGGVMAVLRGKQAGELPEYVPEYVEELAREQRIKQELTIAREVQQSFLPVDVPHISGLHAAALCEPAYETGGDYYDFIPLDDHRLGVAIGDVSGKGIQAAFYMTFVKGILHTLCRETDSPAEVLCKANRLFCENSAKNTFISLVYGIVDVRKKTFTFARAGHNPILYYNRTRGEVQTLRPQGLAIGLTAKKIFDNKIQQMELSIAEDDLFLLYTDGIVEALNQNHEFYGIDNVKQQLQSLKASSAPAMVNAIAQNIKSYIGQAPQHDDMTLMGLGLAKPND